MQQNILWIFYNICTSSWTPAWTVSWTALWAVTGNIRRSSESQTNIPTNWMKWICRRKSGCWSMATSANRTHSAPDMGCSPTYSAILTARRCFWKNACLQNHNRCPKKSWKKGLKQRLFFRFLTRSKTVVTCFPNCRSLPRFAPQVPPIPGCPTCCRGTRKVFLSYLLYPFISLQSLIFQAFRRFFHFLCLAPNSRISL